MLSWILVVVVANIEATMRSKLSEFAEIRSSELAEAHRVRVGAMGSRSA